MKSILLTGGGGYIGSHVLRLLASKNNYDITVIDNLERGFNCPIDIIKKESLSYINFIKMDLRYENEYQKLNNKKFDAILHFAAYLNINESTKKPLEYFENNITGSINLIKYIKKTKSKNFLFSSTCSLYSRKAKLPFTEKSEISPENPYSESKYMMEKIIHWCSKSYKFNYIILRYFNPCGSSLDNKIGYSLIPSPQLIPALIRSILGLQDFEITCGKVNTPDKTTIRDYINILDLADIHEISLKALLEGHKSNIYNIGIGKGLSILEIIKLAYEVTSKKIVIKFGNKREGELPVTICDPSKFISEFKWKPKYTIKEAISTLYEWFKANPKGYKY